MISSVERVMRINREEINEVRETPGCERIRAQLDLGVIDTVCPQEIARAFEMKETAMSKRGIGLAAANGSGINKC